MVTLGVTSLLAASLYWCIAHTPLGPAVRRTFRSRGLQGAARLSQQQTCSWWQETTGTALPERNRAKAPAWWCQQRGKTLSLLLLPGSSCCQQTAWLCWRDALCPTQDAACPEQGAAHTQLPLLLLCLHPVSGRDQAGHGAGIRERGRGLLPPCSADTEQLWEAAWNWKQQLHLRDQCCYWAE